MDKLFCKSFLLLLCSFCLLQGCGQKKDQSENIDYVTDTSGKVDFGRTDPSAYTSEIRANMERLYEDKFGLFVHFGPYAQLEGYWNGDQVSAEWIMKRAFI